MMGTTNASAAQVHTFLNDLYGNLVFVMITLHHYNMREFVRRYILYIFKIYSNYRANNNRVLRDIQNIITVQLKKGQNKYKCKQKKN